MDAWFEVKKKDVIDEIIKKKDCFPWGNNPDEKYHCLIYWEDGKIRITVDEFYELDSDTYECNRFYTNIIAQTIEEFNSITEEKFASIAYNTWCSGAR